MYLYLLHLQLPLLTYHRTDVVVGTDRFKTNKISKSAREQLDHQDKSRKHPAHTAQKTEQHTYILSCCLAQVDP